MEFEEVFTVHVAIGNILELRNDDGDSVVMISFGGTVTGKYFEGTGLMYSINRLAAGEI